MALHPDGYANYRPLCLSIGAPWPEAPQKNHGHVYSKNGGRPVKGPGTGPDFKPPKQEPATSNDPAEKPLIGPDGKPVTKNRKNYKETCYCIPTKNLDEVDFMAVHFGVFAVSRCHESRAIIDELHI